MEPIDAGLRFVANTRGDEASFTALTGDNLVGCMVRRHNEGDLNIAELDI